MDIDLNGYRAVVIGVSAGGLGALTNIFSGLPANLNLPIATVQHIHPSEDGTLYEILQSQCTLKIKEAQDKEVIQPGVIYFAPPDYHLLVERNETFALSIDEKVNYSRPSIDVLFESAAHVWNSKLIGIILTGASQDGAYGMKIIRELGGLTIAQNPLQAEFPFMPQAAIEFSNVELILSLEEIGRLLGALRMYRKLV